MERRELSLILPCYNEGPTFEKSTKSILAELKKSRIRWEVIFVEDKSTDDTRVQVEKFVKSNKNCSVIFHLSNKGRGASVAEGIRKAKYSVCGFMDVDCEIPPSYISLFIVEIKKGADAAVGKRFYEKGWRSLPRVVASKAYALLVRLVLDLPIADTEAGFKFFKTARIIRVLSKVRDPGWFWDTEICARAHWAGLKVTEVPVLFTKQREKKSTVRIIPDSIDYFIKLSKFRAERPLSS